MIAFEAAQLIEKTAPRDLAYDWDNVGFLVGDCDKTVKRVYLTLDTSVETVREAVSQHADMIISHHPLFFNPVKRLEYGTPVGDVVRMLIENNITLYAAHTNMDVASGGINDVLAKKLGLNNVGVIEKHPENPNVGLGRYGTLDSPVKYSEFVKTVCDALHTPVRYCGDGDKIISTVAVGGGACHELAEPAKQLMCDVLVTADLKYHEMLDSCESGIFIIDAGHYPTEVFVKDIFRDILKDSGLTLINSTADDVFKLCK